MNHQLAIATEESPLALSALLIDDDPNYCTYLSAFANANGVSMTSCTDVLRVWEYFQDHMFDAIVIDYDLGRFNGLEITSLLPVGVSVPVIIISGQSRDQIPETVWPGTVSRYIDKQNGPMAILNAVLEVIV